MLACVLGLGNGICASEVQLTNGTILSGTPFKIPGLSSQSAAPRTGGDPEMPAQVPYLMVDDGVRRLFAHRREVVAITGVEQLTSARVTYKLEQQRRTRSNGFDIIGRVQSEPFNEHGRRTVTLFTSKGATPVVQGITEFNSSFTKIVSLQQQWDFTVDTNTLSPEVLRKLLANAEGVNPLDARERLAVVTFYTQAGMYGEAQTELAAVAKEFPDLAATTDKLREVLMEFIAAQALSEIKLRQLAGQHELAYGFSRQFPADDVPIETLRQAQAVTQQYEEFREQRELVSLKLDMLQADLPSEQAQQLASLRTKLEYELGFESLPRLTPFLRSLEDSTLSSAEKLALAYSGWVLGSDHALTNLEQAIDLWNARFHALEYLRQSPESIRDTELMGRIKNHEALNPQRLAWMIPLLPIAGEVPPAQPGVPYEVNLSAKPDQSTARYTVLLPPEYSPLHKYPLLVALRPEGMPYQNAVGIWGGSRERPGWGMRRGYIIITPDFYAAEAGSYLPSEVADQTVMRCIDDARQHWRIDSDRIFLAGHGLGADACFQIGMTHPGVFAGCVPVGGACNELCRFYWQNAEHQSWYIVSGELEAKSIKENGVQLDAMMDRGKQDMICVEYKQRGSEPYFEEQERIFAWMETRRRPPLAELRSWSAKCVRRSDNSFHWLRADAIPDKALPPVAWGVPGRPSPKSVELSGDVKANGLIRVSFPGDQATLWLNPDLFNFDDKCEVMRGNRSLYREFVQPSMQAMLDEVRSHGDRERIWWARIDLK